MDRINSADGQFHDGDPSIGTKGTIVTAVWLNALQEEVIGGGGGPDTIAAETTLNEGHGLVFVQAGAPIHLPIYASVSAKKRYKIKNIDVNPVVINTIDGKSINGQASITLQNYGDSCEIAKDGANWQTIGGNI